MDKLIVDEFNFEVIRKILQCEGLSNITGKINEVQQGQFVLSFDIPDNVDIIFHKNYRTIKVGYTSGIGFHYKLSGGTYINTAYDNIAGQLVECHVFLEKVRKALLNIKYTECTTDKRCTCGIYINTLNESATECSTCSNKEPTDEIQVKHIHHKVRNHKELN